MLVQGPCLWFLESSLAEEAGGVANDGSADTTAVDVQHITAEGLFRHFLKQDVSYIDDPLPQSNSSVKIYNSKKILCE